MGVGVGVGERVGGRNPFPLSGYLMSKKPRLVRVSKVTGLRPELYLKRDSDTGVFQRIL